MGSTNKTAHYELPQFVANDKPSWLGDINQAMEAIDTAIFGAKSNADGAQTTANNAVAGVQTANTRMDGMQTQLDTVATQANQTATTVTGHTSAIATNSANINTLNSRMGNTDISDIGDGTVTGAIQAISEGGGGGGANWTLIDSITSTASGSGGAAQSKNVSVTGYTELLLRIKNSYGDVIATLEGFTTDVAIRMDYPRVQTTSITDIVRGNWVKSTGVLEVQWISGSTLSGCTVELYGK